mmetsp:Transcript_35793/g.86941  ORF Transcript_35793/g.86941 Transcript_35793/m.86941 type:complete len:91 (+) Transcript_35793:1485-1757(+)
MKITQEAPVVAHAIAVQREEILNASLIPNITSIVGASSQFTIRRNFRKPTDSLSCWTILHSSFGKRMLCNSMLVKLLFVYVFAMLRSCYV